MFAAERVLSNFTHSKRGAQRSSRPPVAYAARRMASASEIDRRHPRAARDTERLLASPSPARVLGADWTRRWEHIAAAAAASTLGLEGAEVSPEPPVYPDLPLDFVPRLSLGEVLSSIAAGCGAAALFLAYELRIRSAAQPAPLAVTAAAASVILVAVSAWIQGALRERQQQAAMLTPEQAADKDSIFEDVGGITVHYKRRASASARPKRAFACLHGFGANETSWAVGGAAAGLAERLDAVVVAHDAPGFGLTHRPEKLADYSVERNGALAAALLERAADAAGVPAGSAAQRILIGHSLGGLAAACAAAEDPKPTALILVAPAMIVAGALQRAAKTGAEPPQQRRRSVLTLPLRLTRALTVGVLRCIADTVAVVLSPFIVALLRKLARSYGFWRAGLRGSYYTKSLVTRSLIDPYRRPKVVRGFEAGLVRFLRSRAVPHGPLRAFSDALRYALAPEKPQSALDRLVASGMPVLIIHGENDALVPLFNSRRLAAALPNCRLEVIPKCGHCPQEETPQRFLELVESFVKSIEEGKGAGA